MVSTSGQQLKVVLIGLVASLALVYYQLQDVFVEERPLLDFC